MRGWICILILFFMMNCSNRNSVPAGIIAKDKMERILWDMILADQFSAQFLLKDSARIDPKLQTMKQYAEVLQIHHVGKQEFQKSFDYYISRPDLTKIIFDSLAAQSNRHREEFYYKMHSGAPK